MCVWEVDGCELRDGVCVRERSSMVWAGKEVWWCAVGGLGDTWHQMRMCVGCVSERRERRECGDRQMVVRCIR